eukprot:10934_1
MPVTPNTVPSDYDQLDALSHDTNIISIMLSAPGTPIHSPATIASSDFALHMPNLPLMKTLDLNDDEAKQLEQELQDGHEDSSEDHEVVIEIEEKEVATILMNEDGQT